jgi:HD-like signal output (HDOD) protein
MVFVGSGQLALEELRKAPFDIVVTDMRMPGMDGATLLAHVKAEFPSTARMVLSGYADRASVLRALPVAQQFLSKPCDAETLRSTIDRTSRLHKLLDHQAIRLAIGELAQLPSVPQTYYALAEAAARPDVNITDIADIIEQDPAMSIKVLQLVNSSYFGTAQHVASIRAAVSYLGIEILKGLALAAHAFSAGATAPIQGFSLEGLQNHAIVTARLARRFLTDPRQADEAFTAALVHDVGKIILALSLPEPFRQILDEARRSGRPVQVVEKERLGVTHAEVGGYLLGTWGLPFSIVECVVLHHRPNDVGDGPCEVLAAVHAADALGDQTYGGAAENRLDLSFLERAGCAAELPRWRAIAAAEAHASDG